GASGGDDLTPRRSLPAVFALQRRIIHFAHPRIEAGEHARRTRFLGEHLEGRYPQHRNATWKCESLRDAAGDSQAGERPGPGAEGDRIEFLRGDLKLVQNLLKHGERELGMLVTGPPLDARDLAVAPERDAAPLGRGVERRESHGQFYILGA